ncbi:MAG: gamma-glutamyl-gamma-aminobutyrate hydrolase family protein [Clostridiales bacterium]|nr:gamma-glutamyl-gamma-aminobutyrate hydrolase family protein [Clostridiales bacterium]
MSDIPIIGVSGSVDPDESKQMILRDYMKAILAAGGIPLLLSLDMQQEQLEICLSRLDGVMLAGGGDVDPALYGCRPQRGLGQVDPLRDRFELRLTRACHSLRIPVLGICRGLQVMNVALGGTLYQDLPSHYLQEREHPLLQHRQTEPGNIASHPVWVEENSLLHDIVKQRELKVNTFHHQALWEVSPSLHVCAKAPDGVIEAAQDRAHPFFLGVQWHPERMYREDSPSLALFTAFVQAAAAHARQEREGSAL